MKRWRKILLEAVKQCGRPHVPELARPIVLEEFLDGASAELRLVLDEKGEFSLKELLRKNQQVTSCLVIVGPEGGWDETDRRLFRQKKVPSVSLGARILRAETAPVTILSILQYELGDLSP